FQMELEKLISKFLKSQKLYCEIRKRVPDIHQEIYHHVHQVLLCRASDTDDEYKLQKLLDKFPLDNYLKEELYKRIDILAVNTKKIGTTLEPQQLYPPETEDYLSVCQQLFYATRLCGKTKRPYINYRKFYPDIIHEYEIQIWRFICREIGKFNHIKSQNENCSNNSHFINWLNGCSHNLFKKALNIYNKTSPELPLIRHSIDSDKDDTSMLVCNEEIALSTKIINLIEQDNTGVFRSEHIRDNPEANFRALVLLLRDGKKIKDIAYSFGVPLQSLYTLQKRCINRYRSYIKENI
ncbi:MAG: hypothetical protein AAF349_19745, partial [Cyanobacteria bacterium P01_A01_bin.68]